jgi:class 3 adenylate cyclase
VKPQDLPIGARRRAPDRALCARYVEEGVPGRAIRCACAIRDTLTSLGLEVRAGLHTGEIELCGDKIEGIAVVVGKRVSTQATAGEVLVSRTVADLVAGSDIELHDKGEHELKGVSGTWRLFSVASA